MVIICIICIIIGFTVSYGFAGIELILFAFSAMAISICALTIPKLFMSSASLISMAFFGVMTLDLKTDREYQFRYFFDRIIWKNDSDADRYVHSPYGDCDNSVVRV